MGQMINEMRQEINELRQMVGSMTSQSSLITPQPSLITHSSSLPPAQEEEFLTPEIIEDESVALEERERTAILHALDRHHGNRKLAAADLHISERTLYRKLKEYSIE